MQEDDLAPNKRLTLLRFVGRPAIVVGGVFAVLSKDDPGGPSALQGQLEAEGMAGEVFESFATAPAGDVRSDAPPSVLRRTPSGGGAE